MSAITLDVIMSNIFGIEGTPAPGTSGHRLRQTIRRLLGVSTHPLFQIIELQNIGRREPTGTLKRGRPPTRWPGPSNDSRAPRTPTTLCAHASEGAAPTAEAYVEATIHEGCVTGP
ncbi:MAG: cytochrome P450 [Actinomycetota bacterium]|nr:cytochrome P450 [Actinomycetota bacterium]